MATTPSRPRWDTLTAAPHRMLFFCGTLNLLVASAWWLAHLVARYTGFPLFALDLAVAPIWAHSFLVLFTVLPTFIFGFLFTTFPRWMNGPEVPRPAYIATAALQVAATIAWLAGVHCGTALQLAGAALALAALVIGLVALLRVLIDARQVVSHAVVAATGLAVGVVSLAGFGYGLYVGSDFALHFAVRSALWGFLLPVFFAVCHRMIPFFSQNAIPGYVAWRPLWILVAVVGLAYARLLLGTAGALDSLVFLDVALAILYGDLCSTLDFARRPRQSAALDALRRVRVAADRHGAAGGSRRLVRADRGRGRSVARRSTRSASGSSAACWSRWSLA